MANPNIVATTSIYGRTDVQAVGVSATAITTNASGSGKVYKINSLIVSNVGGVAGVDVDVSLHRSGVSYHLVKALSVPADSSVVVVGKENPFYLMEGDSIRIAAGSSNSVHAICSYEEIA
ncbi:hypothetical protein EBZ80_20935 [bacterium]|nr:hypothetical protein [bacterium]